MKRWCLTCDKEVGWEDVVKGLKLEDGSFFILSPEAIKQLKPEKTDTIAIVQFVDSNVVAPIYYDHHYYVVPQKESSEAYFLLMAALAKYKQAAVGQFVLRDKDAVCLIQPYGETLLLSTLNYAYEILPIQPEKRVRKVTPKELELAHLLMQSLYAKQFDITEFKDTFAARLKQAIKAKKAGRVVTKVEKPKKVTKATLMETLRASLEQPVSRK
jgi:DNA end-binding protein Ku